MPDVFISYARRDSRDFVERLSRELEARGKDPWVDLDDIPPASRWERDLHEGIAGSLVFVYVISPGAVASEHCRRELDHAREANKRIVPVAHREVADAEIPAAIAQLNWIPQQGEFEADFDAALARLVEALETDAEALRSHTRWQQRAEAWRDGGHPRGLLATGAELREADRWLTEQTGRKPEPTPLQAEWVRAGRRLAARRQRLLFAGVVVALIVSAVLGVLALIARDQAIEQRQTARAGELASDAISNLDSDPELSLILALEAAKTQASERTEQVLRRAILASKVRARVEAPVGIAVDSARFSPDGALVAAAVEDGSVLIADSATGEVLRTLQTSAAFASDVDFSPDGRRVVTADSNGDAIVWALDDGSRVATVHVTDSPLQAAAYSPDATTIVAGAQSGYAAIFTGRGERRRELEGLSGRVNSVEFSSDSRTVLTASSNPPEAGDADDGARLWSATDGSPLRTMGSGGAAADAEFSPNGNAIAVAGNDGSASVFDPETGRRLGPPLREADAGAFITRVAFVRGGDQVITAGAGGEVTAWDLVSRAPVERYQGHNGFVLDVGVDPSGTRLLTAGGDSTARVWDLGIRLSSATSPAIATPQFDATGDRVLFADGLVRIVDATTGELTTEFSRDAAVFDAAYSPDRTRIATAESDGRAAILDADSGEPVAPPLDQGDRDGVSLVRWSGDGERLLTTGYESGAKVWNAGDGELVDEVTTEVPGSSFFAADLNRDGTEVVLSEGGDEAVVRGVGDATTAQALVGHTGLIQSLAFDSTGERVLSASDDGTARIWDAESGEQLLSLTNAGNPVRSASWSPDDSLIATAGTNHELRVWDAESGLEILRQSGPDAAVAFSDDLHRIAAVDNDSGQLTVYLCEVCGADIERLERLAAERITRAPTPQERELYLDR